MWLSVRPETEVLFRRVRQVIEKERGEKLDDDAVLEALCRLYLSGMRTSDDGSSVPRGTENGSGDVIAGVAPDPVVAASVSAEPEGVAASLGVRVVASAAHGRDQRALVVTGSTTLVSCCVR